MENTKTHRNNEDKKIINNRLKRIGGQVEGIRKMVDNDRNCNDILTQLSAVENSLKSLSNFILEKHLYVCVNEELQNGNLEIIDEIISIFKRFNK